MMECRAPRWKSSSPRVCEPQGVAPHDFAAPQPAKHLNLGPSVAQSGSVRHVFEHALPTEVQPPSLTMAKSRHSPDAHSLFAVHVALASLVLLVLLHATAPRTAKRRR